MSWKALTDTGFYASMSGPEGDAIRAAALATGQADALDDILAQLTLEVRGYVAGCESNTLSSDASFVPDESEAHAYAIARHRMLSRIGTEATEERAAEYRDARRFLSDVSRCLVAVVQPADAATADTTNTVNPPSISARTRKWSREATDCDYVENTGR